MQIFVKFLLIPELIWNYQKHKFLKQYSVWILGSILGLLIKIGLPLMKNVLTPLAKSMLVLFASKTAVSPEDVGIHQNTIWSRDPKISGFEYKALAKKLKISWRYLKLWCINRRYS